MGFNGSRNAKAATLGLATWFALLTALVPTLHNHLLVEPDSAPFASCQAHAGQVAGPWQAVPTRLAAPGVPHQNHHQGLAHCPACLFLKNFNGRAVVWQAPTPVLVPDIPVCLLDTTGYICPAVVAAFPRAPPSA